ncbi:MAG: hypothetical protein Q8R55_07535 [Candidatus Taylorbacteria bacterium]|nr:hypothetical protein [Candidatus Taylorbacteria bacterium]
MQKFLINISKFGGLFIIAAIIIIVVVAFAIHINDPSYYSQIIIDQHDTLYVAYEFGPLEKEVPIGKITAITTPGNYTYFYSPNKRKFAYETRMPNPINLYNNFFGINVVDLLTLHTKTIYLTVEWHNFYWLDNQTIRVFASNWESHGYYRDIEINTIIPVMMTNRMKGSSEIFNGWMPITREEMHLMEKNLAINNY